MHRKLSDEEFLAALLRVFSASFAPKGLTGDEIIVQLRSENSLSPDDQEALLQLVPVMNRLESQGYIDDHYMLTQKGVEYAKKILEP